MAMQEIDRFMTSQEIYELSLSFQYSEEMRRVFGSRDEFFISQYLLQTCCPNLEEPINQQRDLTNLKPLNPRL